MSILYMLDANVLIAALKGQTEVRQRLESVPASAMRLSTIVLGELEFGAGKSTHGERNRVCLAALTLRLRISPFRLRSSTAKPA